MIKKVTVIGGGLMGSGIAQVVAEAGYAVKLIDLNEEIISRAISEIHKRWNSKWQRGKISKEAADSYKNNLEGTFDFEAAVSEADLVIEAIIESEEAKVNLIKRISEFCKSDTIIASNTSSISITTLAAAAKKPNNFIGTHFISPVPVMKLLEIVPGLVTDEDVVNEIRAFGASIGKVTITSKDSTCFIINRMLDPMLNEAIQLLDDGVGLIEDIDNGMKYGLNHPMGPFELLDMAGIDVEYAVMQVLHSDTGDQKYRPAPLLRKMVKAGFIGKKVGKGFYIYKEDGSKEPNPVFMKK